MVKTIPTPVIFAREALEILKLEGVAVAELEKALPSYALALDKSGHTVTVEGLLGIARLGAEHLKTLTTPSHQPVLQENPLVSYARIVKNFGNADIPAPYQGKGWQQQLCIACIMGDIAHAKVAIKNGADITANNNAAVQRATANGQLETIKYLQSQGADITADNNYAVRNAAASGHLEMVKYLQSQGADIKAEYNHAVRWTAENGHMEVAKYLQSQGADITYLTNQQKRNLQAYELSCPLWQKLHHINPPSFIYDENPLYFKKVCFETIVKMLALENYTGKTAHQMAFHAAGLFQSEQNILKYLEKHGTAGKQPLHDIIQMIKLPKTGNPNLKDWGDAVLKCGPSMAKLVKFSGRLPSPMKSADGRTWSMVNTRAECAKFAFNNAAENPALAALCMEYNVDESDFNTALKIITTKEPAAKNIPDIIIDGEKFDMQGGKFYRLPDGDIRGLFLGEMTACCQSVGSAGANCAKHGYISPDSGFYVVENAKGKIVAQTWAWRGTKGEMCFDSLETLGKNVTPEQWAKILTEAAHELAADKTHNVTALHVGAGGGTPVTELQKSFTKVKAREKWQGYSKGAAAARPEGYSGYRDSKGAQIVVWKR